MRRIKPGSRELTACVPGVIIAFFLLQLLLDVLAFWKDALGIPALALTVIRLTAFLGVSGFGFLLSHRKQYYVLLASIALLYLAGHVLAACGRGYQEPLSDLTDQFRTLMPFFLTAAMMSFCDSSDRALQAMKSGFVLVLGAIALVVLLSVLTGSDPHTYVGKQTGTLGWFLWPNSQSAILSMLSPLTIAWSQERYPNRMLPLALTALGSFGLLFLLGTRLAFVSIPAVGCTMAFCMVLANKANTRRALVVLGIAVLFTGLYPISPMRKNLSKAGENKAVLQNRIDAAVAAYGVDPSEERTDNLDALAAAYRYNLQGLVDCFGIERTAAAFDHTLKQSVIFDNRKKKLVFNDFLMQDANGMNRLFGLEIASMSQQTELYDFYTDRFESGVEIFAAENDIYGVFYAGGWVLLIWSIVWMLWFGLRALLALIRRGRELISVSFGAYCIAYGFFVFYACSTNSVLRQTRNSFCVSAVLAGLWYFTQDPERARAREGGINVNQHCDSGL